MTFLPYHSLRKLAMVNTFFLHLLEAPVLDKILFRKPRRKPADGDGGGEDAKILLPKNVELHPMLTELGSYIGRNLAENYFEIAVLPARRHQAFHLRYRAPTTHFQASSYTHQQNHPTYRFAPARRNKMNKRLFFIVQAALEPATHPPVQQLYLQFMSGMPLCFVKGSEKVGDYLNVGHVVNAIVDYSHAEDLKMMHTLIGKANGDKYVGLVVGDELGPEGHVILKPGFDLEEDGPVRLMVGRLGGLMSERS